MVALIGVGLFVSRLRSARRQPAGATTGATQMHTHEAGQDPLAAHSHGGLLHSHGPMPASGAGVSIRSLLTLGNSGGLVALSVGFAHDVNRSAFGLVLRVAFSLGLAVVLTGT